jgi:hypothetical protein
VHRESWSLFLFPGMFCIGAAYYPEIPGHLASSLCIGVWPFTLVIGRQLASLDARNAVASPS